MQLSRWRQYRRVVRATGTCRLFGGRWGGGSRAERAAYLASGEFWTLRAIDLVAIGDHMVICNHPETVHRAHHYGATAIITAHNHPNGACWPSDGDLTSLAVLHAYAKKQGVSVIDAYILTDHDYFSMYWEKSLEKLLGTPPAPVGTFKAWWARLKNPGNKTPGRRANPS